MMNTNNDWSIVGILKFNANDLPEFLILLNTIVLYCINCHNSKSSSNCYDINNMLSVFDSCYFLFFFLFFCFVLVTLCDIHLNTIHKYIHTLYLCLKSLFV